MKKLIFGLLSVTVLLCSCNTKNETEKKRIITVSIPPFAFFVEAVADSDFVINIMLPQVADHHSWEPLPAQITKLAVSEAFIINGQLGYEKAWMSRFYEVNKKTPVVNLSESISLIEASDHDHESDSGHNEESLDPHFWLSPKEAFVIAAVVKDLLIEINPDSSEKYLMNYESLIRRISAVDSVAAEISETSASRSFMIFHPALGYLARDYSLEQISFEDEGKEPSPARMAELVKMTREKGISTIFLQAEYNPASAKVISNETGARLVIINPMNPDWESGVMDILNALKGGME